MKLRLPSEEQKRHGPATVLATGRALALALLTGCMGHSASAPITPVASNSPPHTSAGDAAPVPAPEVAEAPATAAPKSLDWPPAPAHLPSIAENRRAAPAWWRATNSALVPASKVADDLALDIALQKMDEREAKKSGAKALREIPAPQEVAGLVCSSQTGDQRDRLKSFITLKAPDEITGIGNGAVLFPGLMPSAVRQLEVRVYGTHHVGAGLLIGSLVTAVFAPLVWSYDGSNLSGQARLAPKVPPPWLFAGKPAGMLVDCSAVPRATSEKYVAWALRDFAHHLNPTPDRRGFRADEPGLAALDVAVLVGWADPRAQVAVRRFEAREEELRQERKAAYAEINSTLARQVTLGDREVRSATLSEPAGASRANALPSKVLMQLVNRGPAAVTKVPLSWTEKPVVAVDANGQKFQIFFDRNLYSTSVPAGRSYTVEGQLYGALFSTKPTRPLIAEYPSEMPLAVIAPELPTRLTDNELSLEVRQLALSCNNERVSGTFSFVPIDSGTPAVSLMHLVAIPSGSYVFLNLPKFDASHATAPAIQKFDNAQLWWLSTSGSSHSCPKTKTWGLWAASQTTTRFVRIE